MVPDLNSPEPAYLQIADDLRQAISAGRYPPPSKLPAQRELAGEYGVAIETLRKALDVLAREGLVSAGATKGTFVLRLPGEPEPSPAYQQLATELHRLAERMDAMESRMDAFGRAADQPGAQGARGGRKAPGSSRRSARTPVDS